MFIAYYTKSKKITEEVEEVTFNQGKVWFKSISAPAHVPYSAVKVDDVESITGNGVAGIEDIPSNGS